ncbi:c-type cytochrome [Planctomycetales bacterium ZRK34]|nr:c-type cytochrome [Planctomycetales bacterium ZRK34]
MHKSLVLVAGAVLMSAAMVSARADEAAHATRDDLALTKFAENPDIVTPVAMTFDEKGRLLVVESHTHFRPDDYQGPPHDRIRVVEDTDGDGKADRFTSFYDQSDLTMGLELGPDGFVYVTTRSELFKLRDTDGDGKADQRVDLVKMDTKGWYPHNGLSGIIFDEQGRLYLGTGENLGESYTITGSDGKSIHADGVGGIIYRLDSDGKNLTTFATGFWNAFDVAFASHGRLFMIDNDPDSRPPSRLIHVVEGADYGFAFRYGRSGLHPLQAWDGELPDTLGMTSGTGEAPTGMVYYNRNRMPADLLGNLFVTSWGDHRVEAYKLIPRGASFTAKMTTLVDGGEMFRPTGMAIAPDGSVYFADWVDRNYKLHGKGRIWRLSSDTEVHFVTAPDFVPLTEAEKRAEKLRQSTDRQQLMQAADDRDPFIRQAAMLGLSHLKNPPRVQAQRLAGMDPKAVIPAALKSDSVEDRLTAVRWLADERLTELRPNLLEALNDDRVMSPRLFAGALAALEWLDEGKVDGKGATIAHYVADKLHDAKASDKMRAMALRAVEPDYSALTLDLLRQFIEDGDHALQLEAVRTLAAKSDPERFELLWTIASDGAMPQDVRAEAIVGLAANVEKYGPLLGQLAAEAPAEVAAEATRAVRPGAPDIASKPTTDQAAAWLKHVGEGGDPAVGRRVFFNPKLADCSRCHRIEGRGGEIGPDLSVVGQRGSRQWLLESILQPSREISPQFTAELLTTKDGATHMGIMLPLPGVRSTQTFMDAAGQTFTIPIDQITDRKLMDISLMPPGLAYTMTLDELRDLLAYLMQLR